MKAITLKLSFNKEDSDERTDSGWNWFYGSVQIKDKTYPFSLVEMNTNVGGENTTATEITWTEEIPENSKTIEKAVVAKFEDEFPTE
jgi:hypothetical protein